LWNGIIYHFYFYVKSFLKKFDIILKK
jgi:hypothetical protein